jgi:acyl carrier protein
MADLRTRLEQCFAAVFPDLSADEIRSASTASVPAWDSLAFATLVSVIEEEFGVEIPVDELAELGSFNLLLELIESDTRVG